MPASLFLIAGIIVYIGAARLALVALQGRMRDIVFTLLNLAGYAGFFVVGHDHGFTWALWLYVPLVLAMYVAMRLFAGAKDHRMWIAFFVPIGALVLIRYVPASFFYRFMGSPHAAWPVEPPAPISPYFLGISYMAFRCSRLVLEVRNGLVAKPGFWEYIGFCFFVPTMSVGPINTYANYRRGFESVRPSLPADRALLRILVGCVKYFFLGTLCSQLSYGGLLLDDHLHHWFELPIAAVFYYLYLYCNFSGFCDAAIGVAALIGIPVPENFDGPLTSRNVQVFWNRWHITLSRYMRDMVFSPLSKFLAQWWGPANVDHAVAVSVVVVFLLVGIWHGTGGHYAAFGMIHGVGLAVNHYYTVSLKKWLGREGFKAYNANPWIRAIAVLVTFSFVTASLFFFANNTQEMKRMFSELTW